jgi:hypothetical protein
MTATGSRYARLSAPSQDGRASFAGCPRDLLATALDTVIDAGDLLSLSRTSDGGAICLYVKSGGETYKAYASTEAELIDNLRVLAGIED